MGALATVVSLSVGLGAFAVVQLGRVNDTTGAVVSRALPSVKSLADIRLACADFRMSELQYVAASAADRDAVQQAMDGALERIEASQKLYEPLISSADEKRTYAAFMSAWSEYMIAHAMAMQLAADSAGDAQLLMAGEGRRQFDAAGAQLAALVDQNRRSAEHARAQSTALYESSRWWVIGLVAAVVIVGGGIAWIVLGGVNRVLGTLAEEIDRGAETIVGTAAGVSESADTLTHSAARQAATLDETSAAMERIAATTRANADQARDAAASMAEADRLITTSHAALEAMVASMASIEEASTKVTRIIRTVDEIAFQTNILALNAAVEAARAGAAGAGFAVVAEEVRSLAQRSAQAARDTAALVEASNGRARQGSATLQEVSASVRAFTLQVTGVQQLVGSIRAASAEQTTAIDHVAGAVQQLSETTRQTAASATDGAAASARLRQQAESAKAHAAALTTLIEGRRARRGQAAILPGTRPSAASRPTAPTEEDLQPLRRTGTEG
jgi:hypothetical protein